MKEPSVIKNLNELSNRPTKMYILCYLVLQYASKQPGTAAVCLYQSIFHQR